MYFSRFHNTNARVKVSTLMYALATDKKIKGMDESIDFSVLIIHTLVIFPGYRSENCEWQDTNPSFLYTTGGCAFSKSQFISTWLAFRN